MSKTIHLQVYTKERKHIGHFDGEFFYTNPPTNLRVDDEDVYTYGLNATYIGTFTGNTIESLTGEALFYLEE